MPIAVDATHATALQHRATGSTPSVGHNRTPRCPSLQLCTRSGWSQKSASETPHRDLVQHLDETLTLIGVKRSPVDGVNEVVEEVIAIPATSEEDQVGC
jgi:hypothetical protein